MKRWGMLAMLVACSESPPYDYVGADGPLHATPTCVMRDGLAEVVLDNGNDVTIALPASPDAWGRGALSLTSSEGSCDFDWGTQGARVEYGDVTRGYRPLYVGALSFPASEPCSTCDGADCRVWGGTSFEHWYLWCAQ